MAETLVVVSKIKKDGQRSGLAHRRRLYRCAFQPHSADYPGVRREGQSRCIQEDPRSRRPPVNGPSDSVSTAAAVPCPGSGVRAMFDRIASDYDRFNAWASLGLHQHWRRALLGRVPRGRPVAGYRDRDGGCGISGGAGRACGHRAGFLRSACWRKPGKKTRRGKFAG